MEKLSTVCRWRVAGGAATLQRRAARCGAGRGETGAKNLHILSSEASISPCLAIWLSGPGSVVDIVPVIRHRDMETTWRQLGDNLVRSCHIIMYPIHMECCINSPENSKFTHSSRYLCNTLYKMFGH